MPKPLIPLPAWAEPAGAVIGAGSAGYWIGGEFYPLIDEILADAIDFVCMDGDSESGKKDKKLTDGEIKKLEDAGFNAHDLKPQKGGSKFDLFKDKNGNVVVKPKNGNGIGDPTGININNL